VRSRSLSGVEGNVTTTPAVQAGFDSAQPAGSSLYVLTAHHSLVTSH